MSSDYTVYVILSLYLRQCYPRSWLFIIFVVLLKNNSRDKCIYAVLHLYHFYEKNENVKSPFNFELGGRPCDSMVYTCMNILWNIKLDFKNSKNWQKIMNNLDINFEINVKIWSTVVNERSIKLGQNWVEINQVKMSFILDGWKNGMSR